MRQYSLKDIIEARLDGDLLGLSEASLAYVRRLYAQLKAPSLALLSAWQEHETNEINLRNTDRLRHQIRSARLGVSRLVLHCRFADGAWSLEPWLCVYGLSLERSVRLAQEYQQDFVAFLGTDGGGDFRVLWFLKATGAVGHVDSFAAFDPTVIAAYFYKRGLVFEYLPQGFFEGLAVGLIEKAWRSRQGLLDATPPREDT